MEKYWQKRYLIYYVLLIALLIRLLLLFNGQRFVDGDEGVVGIMARHITEGSFPITRYGQHYGGGHVIEAYLAALLFLLFGIRSEEHTSELQSHSFISYAVFCLKKKTNNKITSLMDDIM